jgi:hypothetical protein
MSARTSGRLSLLAAGAVVAGVGCTLTLPGGSDAATGVESGTADAGSSETVGDQCSAIVAAFCNQAIGPCGMVGFTLADCVNNDMMMCCMGAACSAVSQSPLATVTACTTAIASEDCNMVANSTLPAACQGVPQSP